MKESPILFSAQMVRAILDGSKTQTRRVVKLRNVETDNLEHGFGPPCPFGQPGDRLWVRETWKWHGGMLASGTDPRGTLYLELYVTHTADGVSSTIKPSAYVEVPKQPPQREGEVYSLRDAPEGFKYDGRNTYMDRLGRWWKRSIPAIHMPRWASRINLEITAVRVERLQRISETDSRAEGVTIQDHHMRGYCAGEFLPPAVRAFRDLWQSINGAASWEANPWVWVVEFRRIEA